MQINIFIFIALILSFSKVVAIEDVNELWAQHKKSYDLTFSDSEDEERKSIFEHNYYKIEKHNRGDSSYKLGLNAFSHLSDQEFKDLYLSQLNIKLDLVNTNPGKIRKGGEASDVDWRKKKVVTDVQDQGSCGSCWAFSATGSLEGQFAIKKHKLVKLSEQDLVDCSTSYGNHGCGGGLMEYAFKYIKDKGICNSSSYPYHAKSGKCIHNNTCSVTKIKDFKISKEGDEDLLQEWITKVGPISVAMDASGEKFRHYKSGVYSDDDCSAKRLNHAILAVGMGSKPSEHYIVKNSWGKSWGMKGYFLISRNDDNMCGISSYITYPIL